ncbi:MAG: glycoside hydrolase family 2 TIM barrel-domain containing protein [Rikenellaceae bacterium]
MINLRGFFTLLWCCVATVSANAQYTPDENFDRGWRFFNSDIEGAYEVGFDDSKWRTLDLPHDWAIEGPFSDKYDCRMGALPVNGTGWYRKSFVMDSGDRGRVVRLEFEGAMNNSTVWVNGKKVGSRPYGYIGFEYEISDLLKYDGSENVVAVSLNPLDYSSRWYPGAGLYRSVWLKVDNSLYIDNWGTFITTPTVTETLGVVQQQSVVVNSSESRCEVVVVCEFFDNTGVSVAKESEKITLEPNSKSTAGIYVNIKSPKLWDLESPNLYTSVTTIMDGDKELDRYTTRFGVRKIGYDADGFYLNGKKVRFNGVCLHHDNGALGSAVYRRADERKLQIMRDMGVNAIRTSHNPVSREFLDLCDEMGLLVIEESYDCWAIPKVKNGYNLYFDEWGERDLKDMVLRDRNHPSIIMWSLGNEILEQKQKNLGWKIAKRLHEYCKSVDMTRPTTIGFNNYPGPYNFNMAQQVDIAGANYKPVKYAELKSNYPDMPLYGSETASTYSTRGVYHLPIEDYTKHESLQTSSYDFVAPPWGYAPEIEFKFLEENQSVMGEFVWTGFDYLGETSPYGGLDNIDNNGHWNSDYPSRSSYFGIVDLAGFPKDRYYLYQSQWTTKPMIHLLPHWNWAGMEGEIIPVYCYTNCDEAELFLNGKSLGRKVKGVDTTNILVDMLRYEPKSYDSPYRLSWSVPYRAGELKVVGYKDGEATLEKVIRTAGRPYKIVMEVDRESIAADGRDLAYVTIRIEDRDGNLAPLADNLVEFKLSGAGEIIGVDNGNPISLEPFQAPYRKAFNGLALAIIRSGEQASEVTLKASSKGLKGDTITIKTEK